MTKPENNFTYERTDSILGYPIKWRLEYNGMVFKGYADSVNEAYRKGKRALRRHKRMEKKLGRSCCKAHQGEGN